MQEQRLRLTSQQNRPPQEPVPPLAFSSHHKPYLHRSYKNALLCLLLAHYDPDTPLVIDGAHLARLAFVLNKTPRTIIRQLLFMGPSKYFTLTRERGAFIVSFSKHKPLLNHTPLQYTEMSKELELTCLQIGVYAIVQNRETLGLRQLPQREIARRLGCDKQSVVNAFKALRGVGMLRHKYIICDYSHPLAKKWRTVYTLTTKAWARFKDTIRTLRFFALQKAKRTLTTHQKSSRFNDSSAKGSPFFSWFNKFKQKYPSSDDYSLARTLNAILKKKKTLPTEDSIALAWEIFCQSKVLRLAVKVGWREAFKALLIEKGGVLNDKSRYWKKLSQKRPNFYWFLSHVEEIKEGRYCEKELSEKAKGRVLGEDGETPAPNTPLNRQKITTEWFKGYLIGLSPQKDLGAFLTRLWNKCGWSTYETLLDPCTPVQDAQGRWVFEAPNGHHADLMESRLSLEWWRIVRPKVDKKAHSPMREAYTAWLKEHEKNVQKEQKDEEPERAGRTVEDKGEEKMGFVPGNDDEGVIPYWTDKERSATKARKDHRSRRTPSEDMEASGREGEEEILKERRERQERTLGFLEGVMILVLYADQSVAYLLYSILIPLQPK